MFLCTLHSLYTWSWQPLPSSLPGSIVGHNKKSGPGLSPSTRCRFEAISVSATPCTLSVFSDLPRVLSSLSSLSRLAANVKIPSYTKYFPLQSLSLFQWSIFAALTRSGIFPNCSNKQNSCVRPESLIFHDENNIHFTRASDDTWWMFHKESLSLRWTEIRKISVNV